jgi:hypothetical protein
MKKHFLGSCFLWVSFTALAETDVVAPVAVEPQPVITQSEDLFKLIKTAPISKVESTLAFKGDKLPLVTQLSGSEASLPPDFHSKPIYIEFQGSPILTAYFKNEFGKKGYQLVDDKAQAAYMLVGSGTYVTMWKKWPAFGGQIGHIVEKSQGIGMIDVDQFPECVGKTPDTSVHVDLGAVQSVANYNIGHGSSIAGGVAGGMAVAAGIDIIGEKTGLKQAVNGGFLHVVGGGNLGLDKPICFFGCDIKQTMIINFVVEKNGQPRDLFSIETVLEGTKKHMPNEILAENLKNGLTLF